ncbi:MAG: glycosyltransferase [Maribacter arcticus]|uniref:glycosyltransferase family 2 protein n=1 Tax=Maribacter arcticus TaxID=561365 RepID=UPI003001A565
MRNKLGISFIVIGKNEGWKISLCLQSIFDTISYNGLTEYEVIYIDSASTDDTVKRALLFTNISIFQLNGLMNAAIARNTGAKLSTYETLFFIDGDMELVPKTLVVLYDELTGLKSKFMSGNFENYFYSVSGEVTDKKKHYSLSEVTLMTTTGGLFLIEKNLWNSIGGMRNVFKKSQDLDLGLRLAKAGYKLRRVSEVLAIHHTVSYNRQDRLWDDVLRGNFLYHKALLYRKNILNKYAYKMMIREVSMFFLLFILILTFTTGNPIYLLIYPILIFVKMLYKRKKVQGRFWSLYLRYMVFDFGTILGFLFFWPSIKKPISYVRIT